MNPQKPGKTIDFDKLDGFLDPDLARHFRTYSKTKLVYAAKKTVYQYNLNFRRWAAYLERPVTLDDFDDEGVSGCAAWLINTRKLSPASASKFRDNAIAFWGWLCRKNVLTLWPDVQEIVEPERTPRAMQMDHLAILWEAMERQTGDMAGIPAADWWCSLIGVLWSTGERIGAVMQCTPEAVDLAGGWLNIRAEYRKGRRRDRSYRLHPQAVALLAKILVGHPPRERLFPFPWDPSRLWRFYREIQMAAGLPVGRDLSFHCLRKSVGSHARRLGGNAQEILGHSSAAITTSCYIDPRIAPSQQASDVLPWLAGRKDGAK